MDRILHVRRRCMRSPLKAQHWISSGSKLWHRRGVRPESILSEEWLPHDGGVAIRDWKHESHQLSVEPSRASEDRLTVQ